MLLTDLLRIKHKFDSGEWSYPSASENGSSGVSNIVASGSCPRCDCPDEGCQNLIIGDGKTVRNCDCCGAQPDWIPINTWWDEQRFQHAELKDLHIHRNISGRMEFSHTMQLVSAHWWLNYRGKMVAKFPGGPAGMRQVFDLANNIVAAKQLA